MPLQKKLLSKEDHRQQEHCQTDKYLSNLLRQDPDFLLQLLDQLHVGQQPSQQEHLVLHQVAFELSLYLRETFVAAGEQYVGKWLVVGQQGAPEAPEDGCWAVVIGVHEDIVRQFGGNGVLTP